MKLLIDIPEKLYKKWCCSHPANNTYPEWYIMHGTPLPKGHGRLIDAEDLFSFISDHAYPIRYDCNSIEKGMSMTGISECIRICPTIIEADKGETE